MGNKIFKCTIILIIILTILFVITNYSTREYVYKLVKIYKLKKDIDKIIVYNASLKQRLLNLQTKPKELEKVVKIDLGYINEDEILYKFNDSDYE